MSRTYLSMLLAALLTLTACGSSDGADEPEAEAPAVEASQFPPLSVLEIEEPVQPERPKRVTPAYAEDYARWLTEEFRYGLRTTYGRYLTVSGSCDFCRVWNLAEGALQEREQLVEVEPFELREVTLRPDLEAPPYGGGVVLDIVVHVPELRVVDGGGTEVKRLRASTWTTRFSLTEKFSKLAMTWSVISTDSPDMGSLTA